METAQTDNSAIKYWNFHAIEYIVKLKLWMSPDLKIRVEELGL